MKRYRFVVIALILVCAACAVQATTATAAMVVSANIASSCSISASSMAFGPYDPIVTNPTGVPLNQTATLTLYCTTGANATITIDEGQHPASGSAPATPLRTMADPGTDKMNYNLYKDSGHATVWGNTAPTGVAYVGTGATTTMTVYGQIPGGQTGLDPDPYTDLITVTITF